MGSEMCIRDSSDVVRHAMVERIVKAYDADAARSRPGPDLEDAG